MKNFLRVAALAICAILMTANASAQDNYNATTMGEKVYLETANWGQNSPFNKQIFTSYGGSTNAKAGCVPTAYAIVMRYHEFPTEGTSKTLYNCQASTYVEITDRVYDFSKMPLTNGSGWIEEQQTEVAKFFSHVLHACFPSSIGTSATTVNEGQTSKVLNDYFNYQLINASYQANFTMEQWAEKLRESISNGCPVPYAANNSGTGDTRHMFVVDGYTTGGYFHFNFGWSGSGNGWFKLDNITPSQGDDYSWNGNSQHYALFNLAPNKTMRTITASVSPAGAGTVTVNGSANSAEVMEGITATLVATANSGYTFSHWSKGGAQVGTDMTYRAKVAAEGNEYVANFYTIGSSVNIPVNYDSNMGSVTYNGNIVSATGFNPNEYSEVTLTAEANDGYMFTGWEITEGTETTKSSEKSITFIAKSGITVNANFALAGGEYKINSSNITPSGTGKCSTWTYSKEGDIEGILTLSTANGSTVVNALGTSNRLYAHAYDDSSNGFREITYTLTAKEGFVITGYSLTYVVSKAGQVTVRNATQTQTPSDTQQYTLTYQYANAARSTAYGTRSTEFVLSSTTDSNTQYITIKDFSVTVLSEGAEGGSTPTPDPTPTTYAVTTTANPAAGGTAKFAVGTGSQKTQGDVENGTLITLYATANTGYNFVNWTLGGNVVSTDATCNVSVSQTANYVANFEAIQQPGEPTDPLADKFFRIKVKNTSNYMNIANTNNNTGATSGVTVVAKNESSDTQIFLFEQSGDGYKLKANSGNYIKCWEWNANANATNAGDATVLTFEPTAEALEYLIKWENPTRDDYFKAENGYVYCDAAQGAAATWVLEEVKYTITATANPATVGTVTVNDIEGGAQVSYNGSATLKATVTDDNYLFANWTKGTDVISENATHTINNVTADSEYVANFKKKTNAINIELSEGGTATINGEQTTNKDVETGSKVTVTATPSTGYYFVNWTNGTDVVSTDATYTFTATADTNLKANFEKKVINVTLTDNTNSNNQNPYVFEFVLDDLEGEVTTAAIANKLMEKYPVIKSVGEGNNATLTDNGTSYTYTNTVKLPFEVANGKEDDAVIWYNIYYPANLDNKPNYLSASTNETTLVEKINDDTFAYGDNPTYNTESGNNPISWAIYSVDKSLTFTLKNKVTGKYIKVTGVATDSDNNGKVQNAVFADETNATAFTFARKTESFIDYFAFEAEIDGTTGYLCSTVSSYGWATHYNNKDHRGGWARIEDPAYYTNYFDLSMGLYMWFHEGNGFCTVTSEIQAIEDALANYETITLNTFRQYGITIARADSLWPTLNITINPEIGGFTAINGEEGVTTKRAPADYELPIAAVPAEGYHFVNWTKGTDELSPDAEHTVTISGVKGDVTELTANFAINIYNISVTAGEGGSASASTATVEHGSKVTLTAVANDGYEFVNWTKGTDVVSTDATYTFTATVDGEYVANFEFVGTQPTHYNITVNANISGEGIAFIETGTSTNVTSGSYEAGSTITLNAVSDKDENGYLFVGWYIGDELVSPEKMYTITLNSDVTYTAVFEEGWRVRYSCNYRMGYIQVFNADGTEQIGGTNYVLVKKGSTIQMLGVAEKTYQFKNWTTNATSDFVSSDNPYILEVNSNMNFTANFEPKHYVLTVRANDESYGTVTAESGTFGPASSVKVGIGMTATITATAEDGYKFVNWTKGTDVVSTDATYTVPAINEVNNLVDVEYIANFLPIENAPAGVYYRIGYDGFAAAASAGAARAAGDVQTLTISYANGSFKTGEKTGPTSIWTSSSNSPTVTLTATYEGSEYKNINKVSTTTSPLELSLNSRPFGKGSNYNETKYTIAIDDTNYKITAYSISYSPYSGGYIDGANGNQLAESGLNVSNVSFTVKGTGQNSAVDIQNFTVTIQQVGGEGSGETPETPSNRYYIQSVACGVVDGTNDKSNALKMTQETGATSIFYYADSKLLSYDKGTYVKEDGGTRGLQAVGTSGTVTITTSGETTTIAAPSYMHANSVTSGTNTTYFIDHCGSNPDNHAANHNFVLEEVTTLPVTISSALHATFYAPVAVAIPDGVTAYVLKAEDIPGIETYAWMTSLKNGIIPANTGVILKAAQGTYDFDIVENNDAARAEAVGNVLSGTVAKTKIIEDAYILANREGKIGLYPVAKNSYLDNSTNGTTVRFTNNSHKAYLPVTNDWFGEKLKMGTGFRFIYDDEENTDIEEVKGENGEVKTIYDLQGRKLSEITEPGIYIVGGKKVWVK